MPLLPCCPDTPWPEKLNAGLELQSDNFGTACVSANFTLRWDGTKYEQSGLVLPAGINVVASVQPSCASAGGGPTLDHRLEFDDGGGCVAVRTWRYPVSCHALATLVGWADLPKGCCHLAYAYSSAEFGVWDGIPVPEEIVVIERPPPPCPDDGRGKCCGPAAHAPPGGRPWWGGLPPSRGLPWRASPHEPPFFSAAPVRYSSGSLKLEATDVRANGFGTPWGHTRRFLNRLSHSEILGNGFNWQVEQWPYLVIKLSGEVAAFGVAETMLWFDKTDAGFTARLDLPYTLALDQQAEEYELTKPDGTRVVFDSVTGRFLRWVSPAGAKRFK